MVSYISNNKKNISIAILVFSVCFFCSNLFFSYQKLPDEIFVISQGYDSLCQKGINTPFDTFLEEQSMAVSFTGDESVSENYSNNEMEVSLLGFSLKKIKVNVLPEVELVPCGMTVGVRISTDGLVVLGTSPVVGKDGKSYRPAEGVLEQGDVIMTANGKKLSTISELTDIVGASGDKIINLGVQRNEEIIETKITPIETKDEECRIGAWLRDSTQGIGTITYYNPDNNKFGALGHGILDVDTKKLLTVREGIIMESNIVSVHKGEKGNPGELVGEIKENSNLGEIKKNTSHGLYGYINNNMGQYPVKKVKIASQTEVHEGPAIILSNISDGEIKEYDIYIESVNKFSSDDSKGLVIRITDQALLSKTNGIVQGMSGSPILQDGKLIGAVTHVFVQNPTKGYGIFIENMIKNEIGY